MTFLFKNAIKWDIISFLFSLLFLAVFIVSVSFWFRTKKENPSRKWFLVSSTLSGGILVCVLIFGVFGWLTFSLLFSNTDYKLRVVSTTKCDLGNIKAYSYTRTSGDYKGHIFIYENNNQKVFLGGDESGEGMFVSFESWDIDKKNRDLNLTKNIENSNIESFPNLKPLQNKYNYKFVNTQNSQNLLQANTKKITELHSQIKVKNKDYGINEIKKDASIWYKTDSPYFSLNNT